MKKLPISVIVLTFNEENNIKDCLESCSELFPDIYIVDSFSTDKTLAIVNRYTDKIFQNEFENYSQQRNWALENLPIKTEWVFNLDADHRITEELRSELIGIFSNNKIPQQINGYLISRKTIFMGRWIKYGGHFPSYHSVLFRKDYGYCENKKYDQHFVVDGEKLKLKGTIIDIITDSLTRFTTRHNKWSSLESSKENNSLNTEKSINANIFGNPIERKRFLKNIYNSFPLFVRPFLYFNYRYFLRLGFLDGKEGLIFHFLQGFWFRFLIDAKIYENKKTQ